MNSIDHSKKISNYKCLINPEPITVIGIKTYHPAFFYIFFGKKGTISQFTAVAEKTRGMGTALGAIFKRITQLKTDKKWMGKVGCPHGLLRNDPGTIRTRTKKEMNVDTIREKLAYDLFQELGRGLFLVPKTRLSLQPILNDFTKSNELAQFYAQDGIKESLFIMSSYLREYSDLEKAWAYVDDLSPELPFMKYLEKYHRPPESILEPYCHRPVPLIGLMELLAVGRCLADVDLLGGGGRNAGFVWIRDSNKRIIAAKAVKIDPGYAFRFTHEDTKNASENFVINTHKKLGHFQYHLQDLRDLQTSTGNHDTIVHWNCLTREQQDEFVSVLQNTCRYFKSQEVLDLLFYREGNFSHPDIHHSAVAYLPRELADQMCRDMKEWMQWQLKIYEKPLEDFTHNNPIHLLRMHYIDHFGELPLPMTKETFPIRELFTELTIVDSQKNLKDILPEVDSFKETTNCLNQSHKKSIVLEDLFKDHRKTLLIGRAGIGKSTICQKAAHDWASGKLWEDNFEIVLWIQLRDLNDVLWQDQSDFLLDIVIPSLFKQITFPKKFNYSPKKTLLILDGYDEANEFLAAKINNLLVTTPFYVLITSRPGKVEALQIDQVVENIGFSDLQIKNYIDLYLKRYEKNLSNITKGGDLFSLIKNSTQLYPIAHIPLQLQMILSIYDKSDEVQKVSSLTSLYKMMTSELYDWHLRGQKKDEKEKHLLQLGKIAFMGMKQGNVIPYKRVQHLISDSLLDTGILKKIEGEQPSYSFVHLTFQEYLTALYILSKSAEKQTQFILENKHRANYQLILAFMAGLIHLEGGKVENLFELLFQASSTMALSHSYLLELTFRCLNECEGFNRPIKAIENLVKKNPKIWNDTVLSDHYSPIHSVANQRQNHALFWLIENFPELMTKKESYLGYEDCYITPFSLSIERGNIAALRWMCQKKSKLIAKHNYINKSTATFFNEDVSFLHLAAFRGKVESIKFLIEKDPSLISKFTSNGTTALHEAAKGGHVDAIEILLDIDSTLIFKFMKNGFTPLHMAAGGGHVESMEILLKKDPDLILKSMDDTCRTPFFRGIVYRTDLEQRSFYYGDFFSCYFNEGNTPLHLAAGRGHLKAGKWLFQKHPPLLNHPNKRGQTPLTLAKLNYRDDHEFIKWIESVGGLEITMKDKKTAS